MDSIATDFETLPDGAIRVCVERSGDRRCVVVSSMHLVSDAEARLTRCLNGEIPNGR